jgi:soluble lytic murein transglycosylase-like protein
MRLLPAILVLGIAATAPAQTFAEYLQLRKANKVSRPTEAAALEAFVGTRTIEVDAVVQGIVRSGETQMLILDRDGGGQLLVRCAAVPDWITTGVKARLLMRASRTSESAALDAELLGAAASQQMAAYDAKNAPKPRTSGSRSSRSKGRPAPMPGELRPAGQPTSPNLDQRTVGAYSAFIRGENPRLSPATADRIAQAVLGYSEHFGVDARLVMAVVLCESGFNPQSRSRAGAMGLGQLMPGTARELGVTNAYDTEQNLYGTVKLLRQHIDRYDARTGDSFQSLVLSLAAYNAGPGAVSRHGGVPPYRETQNYVRKVVDTYRRLVG